MLDISIDALLAHARQRTPTPSAGLAPLVLRDRHGRTLHAWHAPSSHGRRPGSATRWRRRQRHLCRYRQMAAAPVPDALAQLDTGDAAWRSASDKARRVANKGIALLIQGESGVGKELVCTRRTRQLTAAQPQPVIAINCAAIPEHLIEAEPCLATPLEPSQARQQTRQRYAPARSRRWHLVFG